MSHEVVEKNIGLMTILIIVVISIAGLVEIVPLFFLAKTTQPVDGLQPRTALQVAGRNVYVREGCYNCHSQMIRPFRAETERYGHYSLAGEFVYDHPFQWGSKRTGPDLARVGGRYTDEWQYRHLLNPRSVVPQSIMPSFPWLAKNKLDAEQIQTDMRGLKELGVPYTKADIEKAPEQLKGKTEMDALIAYLQSLGTDLKGGQ